MNGAPHLKDISGSKFGRLLAVRRHGSDSQRLATFWCICDCGSEGIYTGRSLRSGNTSSCGCAHKDALITRNLKHGMATSQNRAPEYNIWRAIKARCGNENSPGYAAYGGRGIDVCSEWDASFETFYADMGPRPSPDHSIDRINNDQGYSPENCRWATRVEQMRNTRQIRPVYRGDGEVYPTLADAAEAVGGDRSNISKVCLGRWKSAYGHTWSYSPW